MRLSASWLRPSMRALFLGALLTAAWIIFGAASAQASEPLPPLTDTVHKITGTESPDPTSQISGLTGPVGAILEPVAPATEPLAAPARRIVDPVLVPLDAALAPVAAPVTAVIDLAAPVTTPVTGIAATALSPVTSTLAEITTPVTGVVTDVVAPVTAAVGPAIGSLTVGLIDEDMAAASPTPAASAEGQDGDSHGSGRGAETAALPLSESPLAVIETGQAGQPLENRSALPSAATLGGGPEMQRRNPGPGLPGAPAPGLPATAPTVTGAAFRAAIDAGSGFADTMSGFRLFLTGSPATDTFRHSDELPSSLSLEHGFSPD